MVTSRGASWRIFHIALPSSVLVVLLNLSACGVPESSTAAPTPAVVTLSSSTTLVSTAAPAAPTAQATTTAPAAWQSYRNDKAGYTVEYPKDWTVDEQQASTNGTGSSIVTTFRATGTEPHIVVTTLMHVQNQAEPQDMPNTRCQQVQGNRGIATRCLDTIAFTTSTTIVSQGKTYMIASAGKGMDESIYQHILDSFAPFAAPASQAGADIESLLFKPGDLPDGITASHSDNPLPLNFEDNPPAATTVGLSFVKAGRGAGNVSVLLYSATGNLSSAFTRLTSSVLNDEAAEGNTPQPSPPVGEQAKAARFSLASSTYGKDSVSALIFTRCRALIDIRLNESAGLTMETATAYAQALDKRLNPKVCP